jgi:hypothetical protein
MTSPGPAFEWLPLSRIPAVHRYEVRCNVRPCQVILAFACRVKPFSSPE